MSEFEDSQGYTEKPYLTKPKQQQQQKPTPVISEMAIPFYCKSNSPSVMYKEVFNEDSYNFFYPFIPKTQKKDAPLPIR